MLTPDPYENENAPDAGQGVEGNETSTHEGAESVTIVSDNVDRADVRRPAWACGTEPDVFMDGTNRASREWVREIPVHRGGNACEAFVRLRREDAFDAHGVTAGESFVALTIEDGLYLTAGDARAIATALNAAASVLSGVSR